MNEDDLYGGNTAIKMQISALEVTQPRALRETVLGIPGALDRLRAIDNQIAALREQLTPE